MNVAGTIRQVVGHLVAENASPVNQNWRLYGATSPPELSCHPLKWGSGKLSTFPLQVELNSKTDSITAFTTSKNESSHPITALTVVVITLIFPEILSVQANWKTESYESCLALPESWNSKQNREQREPSEDWTWNTGIHAASPDFQTINQREEKQTCKDHKKIDRKL